MKNLFLIFTILLFTSCLGVKKATEKTTSTNQFEKIEAKRDSSNVVNTNKAITDKIITTVATSGNEETDAKIDEILMRLNTQKSSGGNSYKFSYDKETRQLVTDFIIAQTQDKQTATNNNTVTKKSFEEKTDEYISKKITALPWWSYLVVTYLFRSQLISLFSFFFPGIRTVKSIKDVIK